MERLCTGMIEKFMPRKSFSGLAAFSDLYKALQRKSVICLFTMQTLSCLFFFFFWTTVGETWAALAFLRASLTEWNRLASSLKPWACRQFLSSVSAVKVSSVKCSWVLATRMIQPLSLSNSFTVNSEILSTYDVPLVQLNFDSIHVVLMGTWPGICREHLLYIWKKTPLLF